MHVKCIHDLCGLLGHILSYFIVIKDLGMFSIDFGDFLNNPILFGFNTTEHICLFCMFLTFKDL
jgi:hypothetical protein